MKKCFKCGDTKPLDEFYKHPAMGDGHLNKCKDCAKADASARLARLLATPEGRRAERARGREKYQRLYAHISRKRSAEVSRQWVVRNPHKRHAHSLVQSALRSGRLVRLACAVCADPETQAHHDDYSKPLEVRWLCTKHHAAHHVQVREIA